MNEAAIIAARRELTEISKEEIADALERIVAGAAKEGAVMSEKKKKLVDHIDVLWIRCRRCLKLYPSCVDFLSR